MGKKRSTGVTVYGVLAIIFSAVMLFSMTSEFIKFTSLERILNIQLRTALQIITALGWLIFGIGVLNLLPWARIGIIIVAIYYIIDTFFPLKNICRVILSFELISLIIITTGLIFFGSTIYFFNRPKVKKQFK